MKQDVWPPEAEAIEPNDVDVRMGASRLVTHTNNSLCLPKMKMPASTNLNTPAGADGTSRDYSRHMYRVTAEHTCKLERTSILPDGEVSNRSHLAAATTFTSTYKHVEVV